MDLKEFLAGRENKNREFYWAVVIESGWIQAGVWEIVAQKAEVISVSPPAAWETDGELVGAADTALSSVIQSLSEEIKEPSKTVFGVPSSWVENGQIKDEYLGKIKKICVDLSLDPTGFVVLPEAIAHLIKTEEGAPLNAIVVGIGKNFLDLAVFKLGNLVGTATVARSVSVFEDVVEGLTRFAGGEPLPSRVIVYNGKGGELEEAKQGLMAANWENLGKIKFLHTPKVEIFIPEKKVLATALAGAAEIAGVSLVEKRNEEKPFEEVLPREEEYKNVVVPEKTVSPEDLGFLLDEDITKLKPKEEAVVEKEPQRGPKDLTTGLILKLKSLLARRKGKINLGWPKMGRLVTSSAIFLLVFLVSLFLFLWFYPKADVRIYATPKRFEEKIQAVVDPNQKEIDLNKTIFPAEVLITEVEGEKTKTTTGTKRVGEKARGNIKIQNGTAQIINLPAGTLLAAANNLRFGLTSSASVSAALSPSDPGTQIVDIMASDIGAEYNLAKDEIFKVANYPKADVDAVSTVNFSGGSSREISAVSDDDQKNLEEKLTSELILQAKKNLLDGLSPGKVFIEASVSPTSVSNVFDGKVGDEATNVKLSLKLKITGLAVNEDDLNKVAKKVLEGVAPNGFVLNNDQLSFDFEKLKDDGEKSVYNFRVIADFLPVVNPSLLAKEISGRDPLLVEQYFTSIAGFSRAEIDIRPKLPKRLRFLPRIPKNISIEVIGER